MKTLFENNEFRLLLTGHDYDFVGIIETKTEKPLTFFFFEQLCENIDDADDFESEIDESKTKLIDVYQGMSNGEDDPDNDEEQETANNYLVTGDFDQVSYFRTRDDKSTGFMSDLQQRGQFLALVKNYCPEKLALIAWA